jgi:hypothetical protein
MVHTRVRRMYRQLDELRHLSRELLARLDTTEEETQDGDTSNQAQQGRRAA